MLDRLKGISERLDDFSGLWGFAQAITAVGIAAVSFILFRNEVRKSRAIFKIKETTWREHFESKDVSKSPSRALWFALANTGGFGSMPDMGKSYVLLEKRPLKPGRFQWIGNKVERALGRYWWDRLQLRLRRIGRLHGFLLVLQSWRWETFPIAIQTQDWWLKREMEHRSMTSNQFPEIKWGQDFDIRLEAGATKAYVGELSRHKPSKLHACRAVLVVRPMVGRPVRMRFTWYEPVSIERLDD